MPYDGNRNADYVAPVPTARQNPKGGLDTEITDRREGDLTTPFRVSHALHHGVDWDAGNETSYGTIVGGSGEGFTTRGNPPSTSDAFGTTTGGTDRLVQSTRGADEGDTGAGKAVI